MHITSSIPNGNGRIRRISPGAYEIELIAYSKGSRYFCVEVSSEEEQTIAITLVPDRWFRVTTFPYKCEADVWICRSQTREWKRVPMIEATPEQVRLTIPLEAGERYLISSEPPYRYSDTTAELFAIAQEHPDYCSMHLLGVSMEERPIFGLRITDDPTQLPGRETRPVIHIAAGEHASESAGEEIARGMLYYLLSDEASAARESYIFDIVLNTNPDGNFHGWHQYNLRDWLEHSYSDREDRSWHHEFVPYLKRASGEYSSETVALMEWMKLTRPACYLSMHSWEGQGGTLGAYHSASDSLGPEMAAAVDAFLEVSDAAGAELGFSVDNRASSDDGLHLGHFLMRLGVAAAYLPEGNYMLGRERLQAYGQRFLEGLLEDGRVAPAFYDRSRWDQLAGPETAPRPQERLISSLP